MGRALRIMFGVVLIAYAAPVYFRAPSAVTITAVSIIIGLVCLYTLIHIAIARRVLSPVWGAIVTSGLLVAVYVAGSFGLPLIGHGRGQLAAVTFLGISLIIAGARALSGCELMAIPCALIQKECELPGLIFSPLDRLERSLRKERDGNHT